MDKPYDPAAPAGIMTHAAQQHELAMLRSSPLADMLARQLDSPRYRPEFTRVATAGSDVVGAALLEHKRFLLGPATLQVGLVNVLPVQEPWRDQRVFAALLGDILRVMSESGFPLALMSGAPADLTPFGFAIYRLVVRSQGWHASEHLATLRVLDPDDSDDLAALYAATYDALPLSEARATPDWRAWFATDSTKYGLNDTHGRLIAYATITNGTVTEAAAADAGAARNLLAALPAAALTLPLAHPVTQAALHMGAEASVAAHHATIQIDQTQHGVLAGVVDLPIMLEQLAPAFEQRLARSRYAGWSGNIRVEIDTERVTLAFTDGRAEMIDGSRPADLRLRRVALPALAQLCLGYRAVSDLRATGELDFDDSALGLLEILFPVLAGG